MNKQEKIEQLYKIQVDCLKTTEEQFNNMVEVLDNLGLKTLNRESDLEICEQFHFLQIEGTNYFVVFWEESNREIISYEDFMKRFSNLNSMKQNQITLDKTKAYDISELNGEQMKQIAEATGDCQTDFLNKNKHLVLYYKGEWLLGALGSLFQIEESKQTINAKTLFK